SLASHGISSKAYVCDIGNREAIPPFAEAVLKEFKKIDILVNNAGATWGAPAEDHPLEAWDKLVNVNLTGAFVLTQIIGKQSMIPARWGRIINVASIAGLMGQDQPRDRGDADHASPARRHHQRRPARRPEGTGRAQRAPDR